MIDFLTFFFYFFFFALGAIVGSFLNVVALRINTGKSMVFSRSSCFTCDKKLAWYELVPIFSFLFQKGKCLNCKSRISYQYIIVEFITGAIFVAIARIFSTMGQANASDIRFDLISFIFYAIIFSLLIIIVIYDLKHLIIPDQLSYTFSFLAFIHLFFDLSLRTLITPSYYSLLAGPIIALPFAFIWFISRGKWMGFGDAKLALGIGWLLGLTGGISSIMYAFWIGAVVSILMIILNNDNRHKLTMKSEVPFAPFMILGLGIVFFTHFDLVRSLLSGLAF